MSRPLKTGLDYFPMDVEMDDKVELIEAKHGITGFGVLVKLYQKIYKEGYFINVTEETLLILSKRINVDINKVNEVIKDCLKYDIFSDKLYKSFKILTSAGIQKRYLQAVDRRKDIELIKKYIIVDINGLNVNINWINDGNSTQSKVKESIVKESIFETAQKFYSEQCQVNGQNSSYKQFADFILGANKLEKPLIDVLSIRDQLTAKQFNDLIRYKKEISSEVKILDCLLKMENDSKYTKGKKVLYTCLQNWVSQKFIT